MRKNKGFTLIELLVVLAVIGILAAVVLSSANTSRQKTNNSSIKANMRTISQQMEIQFLNVYQGRYGSVNHSLGSCVTNTSGDVFADATIQKAVAEIMKQNGNIAPTCISTATQWAVASPLKTAEGSNTYWCIETEGKAKGESANITGTVCP